MSKNKYTVIKDTREQDGWFFSPYDRCEGMEMGTLNTGDYTIKGFEDVVCVERKASVTEIANNLGRNKKTFYKEMERMRDFPFRYLLLEFSSSDVIDYPYSIFSQADRNRYFAYQQYVKTLRETPDLEGIITPVPKPSGKKFTIVDQTKISGKYLIKSLMEIQIKYEINVLFCDNKKNAFLICNSIFKRLMELFKEGSDEVFTRENF